METQLPIVRNKLIDKALLYAIIFIYPLLFASLIRIYNLGWHFLFYFHIAFTVCITILYFCRAKLSIICKTICFSIVFFLFSFVGSLCFGLAAAMFFYLFVVTINTVIFGYKAGAIAIVTAVIGIAIAALLHSFGLIKIGVNLNDYCVSLSSWISYMLAMIFVFFVTVITINTYNKFFISNIDALNDKIKGHSIAQEQLNQVNLKLEEQNLSLQKLNIEYIAAKEKAEESDRLKTAFLQNMSHEIRTPMNAIMGFSGLLVENAQDITKLKQFTAIINQRCNDLLDIINDILDISKIESGQLPVHIEECNLSFLFKDLTSFFYEYQNRLNKQHIKFSLSIHCGTSENIIFIDQGKLKQIFINLISNAFKFTDEGVIEGGCKLDKNNNLIFYVSDTGIGIPIDKQEAVFERFYQIHEGSKFNVGGTGLGLYIVKGLVNLLGGKILLESLPGKGSTFSFTIPYTSAKQIHHKTLVAEKSYKNNLANKTILIVEDDLYNAEYLKELLSNNNLNIFYAKNGKEAIEISISQPIDLVLMDIRLPDINGYEATLQIKQHKPDLKIIAQTAYAAEGEKQKALNAGCIDYISKPTMQEALLTMLNKHL